MAGGFVEAAERRRLGVSDLILTLPSFDFSTIVIDRLNIQIAAWLARLANCKTCG